MGRRSISIVALLIVAGASPLLASDPDSKAFSPETISALEVRISQAQPREQCVLYAELVHQMTEVSLKQYSAGDVNKAAALLHRVQEFAGKIHMAVHQDDKRLKNAEILLRHTAFRLNEMLHSSSFEDRPLVAQTLAQVNQADSAAMLQVFRK